MYKDTYNAQQLGTTVIEATQNLMQGIWSFTKRERIAAINQWLVTVSAAHNMQVPEFEFVEGNEGIQGYRETGGGITIPVQGQPSKIILYRKFSLTTLLHEFRHAMQQQAALSQTEVEHLTVQLQGDIEEDAREWSCSLYFNSDPARYMRAVQKGILHFA